MKKITLAILMCLPALSKGYAQELRLFEPVAQAETNTIQTNQVSRARESTTDPQFTLLGTSRIGNRYTVMLQTPDGETVVVKGQPDSSILIPGHSEFQARDFSGRELTVVYPSGTPCVSFEDKGVTCGAGNTARLTLATADPIEVQREESRSDDEALRQDAEAAESEEPTNPFAAALRRAANQTPEEAAQTRARARSRSEIRRIPPEEVPEGMRVVRTPFGDRLVEL